MTTTNIEIDWGSWPSGVTEAVTAGTHALAEAGDGTAVTLTVPALPAEWWQREALREALRSLIHASVMERPKVRANLVFGGNPTDHSDTVRYVDEATFIYGATIDLGPVR